MLSVVFCKFLVDANSKGSGHVAHGITFRLPCYININIYLQSTNSSKRARQSLNSKWPNTQAPLYPSSDSLLLSPETPVSIQSVAVNLR